MAGQIGWTERLALSLAGLIGLVTLVLWLTSPLAVVSASVLSEMTANSAAAIVLSVLSLALSSGRPSSAQLRLSQIAASIVAVLGAAFLVEYVSGLSFGIDTWLPHAQHGTFIGRPSPQTSLALTLTGASSLFSQSRAGMRSVVADGLTVTLIALNLVLLGGCLIGAAELVGLNSTTRTSLQTLLCLCSLAVVISGRRARYGGRLSVLRGVGLGSRIARTALPVALALPFALFGGLARLISLGAAPDPIVFALAGAGLALVSCAGVIWMAGRIDRLEHALRELSLTDDLTHLNNRRGFYLLAQQVLRDAARAGSGTTVFYFDLDGLKHANDTIGHEAGSVMIQSFAAALLRNFRDTDVVGRLGGDEFAVVTSRNFGQATEILARFERSVALNEQFRGSGCKLEYSVGYAELSPPRKPTLDELIAQADAMMYRQKATKKRVQAAVSPLAASI